MADENDVKRDVYDGISELLMKERKFLEGLQRSKDREDPFADKFRDRIARRVAAYESLLSRLELELDE